ISQDLLNFKEGTGGIDTEKKRVQSVACCSCCFQSLELCRISNDSVFKHRLQVDGKSKEAGS
ncbi:hypothetical protein RYX36_009630, partial [Vicia faba]